MVNNIHHDNPNTIINCMFMNAVKTLSFTNYSQETVTSPFHNFLFIQNIAEAQSMYMCMCVYVQSVSCVCMS